MKKIIPILLAGATLLGGCATNNKRIYEPVKVNPVIAKDLISRINNADVPLQFNPNSTEVLSLNEAKEISSKYGTIAPVDVNIYHKSDSAQRLNTARPVWVPFDGKKLANWENAIPQNSLVSTLYLGGPTQNFLSPESVKNEFSNKTGLLAIENFSPDTNRAYSIEAYLNEGLFGKDTCKFRISFDPEEKNKNRMIQKRNFVSAATKAVIEIGLGALYGQEEAGRVAVLHVVENGFGLAEGRNHASSDTKYTTDRTVISPLEGNASDVHYSLGFASQIGTTDIALVEYNNGLGAVYMRGARNVHIENGTLNFEVPLNGPGTAKSLAYNLFRAAIAYPGGKHHDRTINFTGGVIGGAGGGPGVGRTK